MIGIPSLQQLQHSFKQHLMHQDPAIAHWVKDKGISRELRLAIYANAYRSRLIEALETDYPALLTVLGAEEFYRLGHAYIDRYPSRFYTLRLFGQFLPVFLQQTSPWQEQQHLAQLARFEWTFVDAFDAVDEVLLQEADVAAVPPDCWPQLRIRLHPSVYCFDYDWNILPLWKAATARDDVSDCATIRECAPQQPSLPAVTALPATETCVIWRHKLRTQYRTMDADEVVVLKAVMQGDNFSQLCECLIPFYDDTAGIPMRAAGLLKTWLAAGMLTGLEYAELG